MPARIGDTRSFRLRQPVAQGAVLLDHTTEITISPSTPCPVPDLLILQFRSKFCCGQRSCLLHALKELARSRERPQAKAAKIGFQLCQTPLDSALGGRRELPIRSSEVRICDAKQVYHCVRMRHFS